MTEFVFWKMAFDKKWASEDDIASAVTMGLINQDQGNMILGKVS